MIAKKPAGTVRLLIYASKFSDYQTFEGNPFLLTPVIHDTKKGAGALQWAKVEALKRYRLFAENKKKDLSSYNRTAEEPLPRVVIVVDDLFDLLPPQIWRPLHRVCRPAGSLLSGPFRPGS